MRKKKTVVEQPKAYRINDRRGIEKQASIYPTPNNNSNYTKYRPRLIIVGDTPKVNTGYDRYDQIGFARNLFTSLPDLGGALHLKATWAVDGGFDAVYAGENKEWGDQAEDFLRDWYKTCNVLGPNFDFRTTLHLSSLSIDVDGDSALVLKKTTSGYPQIQLIPSHRIGQRVGDNSTLVKGGKFDGYRIFDGCIVNDSGRPIGYRVLGDKKEDDVDVSAAAIQLLYEPEWCDQLRGISRIARSILDWLDTQDVDEYYKRSIKLGASIGLIHLTEDGQPDSSAITVGASEDESIPTDSDLTMEYLKGGEVFYMKAGTGEDIKPILDQRPSTNTMEFLNRIQRRALFSCGVPVELLDPSKLNGGAVRLIQDLARKSISSRQTTLERRARYCVNYAITRAMNSGLLPQNEIDWYAWTFTRGNVITVDNGNEAAADREGLRLGTKTMSSITTKDGKDWYDVRLQQQKEVEDLLERVTVISKKYGISMDAALALMSQRSANQIPVLTGQPTQPVGQ